MLNLMHEGATNWISFSIAVNVGFHDLLFRHHRRTITSVMSTSNATLPDLIPGKEKDRTVCSVESHDRYLNSHFCPLVNCEPTTGKVKHTVFLGSVCASRHAKLNSSTSWQFNRNPRDWRSRTSLVMTLILGSVTNQIRKLAGLKCWCACLSNEKHQKTEEVKPKNDEHMS